MDLYYELLARSVQKERIILGVCTSGLSSVRPRVLTAALKGFQLR
jgi:hypothetical protein